MDRALKMYPSIVEGSRPTHTKQPGCNISAIKQQAVLNFNPRLARIGTNPRTIWTRNAAHIRRHLPITSASTVHIYLLVVARSVCWHNRYAHVVRTYATRTIFQVRRSSWSWWSRRSNEARESSEPHFVFRSSFPTLSSRLHRTRSASILLTQHTR